MFNRIIPVNSISYFQEYEQQLRNPQRMPYRIVSKFVKFVQVKATLNPLKNAE
jgi:hypothetical protein